MRKELIVMSLIIGFRCNCCGLVFDYPAYIEEKEMCPACYCEEFTAIHQQEDAEDAEN